jgi:hypothetical protein
MATAERKKQKDSMLDDSGKEGAEASSAVASAPFRLRLRAWWDGASLQQVMAEEARRIGEQKAPVEDPLADETDAIAAPPPVEVEAEPDVPWPPSRIAVAEAVFGSGAVGPGGTARTIDMIGGFGLRNDVNVLEVGSRLGGTARMIALKYDAWVTGYEPDPQLAEAAMMPQRINLALSSPVAGRGAKSSDMKLADKARIHRADLETLEIKPGVYDCAFARATLHRIRDKTRLLEELFIGLKPHCPLLLTDYFVAPGTENDHRLDTLMGREPGTAPFWSVLEAEKELGAMGFDLRISDDISAQYRHDLLADFARFVEDYEGKGIPPKMVEPLLRLAEFWGNRMMAIDEGLITVHKFVVLRSEG